MIYKTHKFTLISIVLLFFQNLIIYWNHYFNGLVLGGDFIRGYYIKPAFWTSAIQEGIFPQWIPFQQMGYPFFILTQNGFYYPFMWVFPLLTIPYTLDAALIFQNLHIVMGSVGMFFLLKLLFKSNKYALLGAVAFQFFGGFYGHANQIDIVRAYAILPWFFYILVLNKEPNNYRRLLFIPILIFVLSTGGYPGIFIASLFMIVLFIVLQTFNGYFIEKWKKKIFLVGIFMFGLVMLGISLSAVQLGPIYQYGDELNRFQNHSEMLKIGLNQKFFGGFFMSNSILPGQLSMTSFFLPLPIFVFASFLTILQIKKYWIYFVMMVVAVLMAAGKSSPLYTFFASSVEILSLSRFPISDYNIFIIIPIIILAIAGLKTIFSEKISVKTFTIRGIIILSWFSLAVYSMYSQDSSPRFNSEILDLQVISATTILFATMTIIAYFVLKSNLPNLLTKQKNALFTILMACIIVHGFIVVFDMPLWRHPSESFDRWERNGIPLEKDGRLAAFSIFENLPNERPERVMIPSKQFGSDKGLLTGDYMMSDKGSTTLVSRILAGSNENYANYMLMKWTPLFLEPPTDLSKQMYIPESVFSDIESKQMKNSIVQTHYGINEITYKVSLENPKLMIENEIYFPGWKSTLIFSDHEEEISAIEVNDVFRSWVLPAGDYEMEATFQFPNLLNYQIISLSSLTLWIIIMIIFVIRSKKELDIIKK